MPRTSGHRKTPPPPAGRRSSGGYGGSGGPPSRTPAAAPPGVGQAMAHVGIPTSVLTHPLTFHEPVDASEWHLLAHESPYAGRGRSYGRANIFTADGRLVGSFVQDNMIRDFPE